MGMQLVRTLCYPGGFGKDREGGEPSPALASCLCKRLTDAAGFAQG